METKLKEDIFRPLMEVHLDTQFDDEVAQTLLDFGWKQTIIWSLCSFTISVALCMLTRIIQKFIKKPLEPVFQTSQSPNIQNVIDFKPNPVNTNETFQDAKATIEEQITPLDNQISMNIVKDSQTKSNAQIRPSEKRIQIKEAPTDPRTTSKCSSNVKDNSSNHSGTERRLKAKEEPSDLLLSSRKDIVSLTKKLESLARDKKEMAKHLSSFQKENERMKQQLSDILNDRTLLIKRLECATREIKLNTSTKQMTLDKLEDAINCSNHMKAKIIKLTKDKQGLVEQVGYLEKQYKSLKGQAKALVPLDSSDRLGKTKVDASDANLMESEKDIQKVQTKLVDLERSLENMRLLNSQSTGLTTISDNISCEKSEKMLVKEVSSNAVERQAVVQDSTTLTIGRSIVDCNQSDMLVREAKSYKLNEGVSVVTTVSEKQIEQKIDKIAENLEHLIINCESRETPCNEINSNVATKESWTGLSVSTENSTQSDITIAADESEANFTPGIVSQSPAFQKFLLKVLDVTGQDY